MMEGSPQRFLHDPIVEYLTKRGVTINTNTRIADLLYDTDKDGAPTKINGFVLSGTHHPHVSLPLFLIAPFHNRPPSPLRLYLTLSSSFPMTSTWRRQG